ncbi:type I glyceraldehyde-3-phosphate dehydrogenase [Belliella kenyensis]|uniref:Glyceraldehyde-3-phosphate dehydrogenase n=1 Tax=Belliella kenyensis TaxID=1472724 RepID=A0ABV8EJ21_9BACT|nr:type I glyceraldehyde-3-phosphate dehydrogenase [Belliella kenyensis]MCH7400403.1 type I glyceraldehyde-3-phosphate dehydrogenase [Belliella kenyensis]MDN3604579.1 type I glyceraldehyde-3-phosphate dehydrogenase [Belliella kenyensis]
MNKKRVVVNGCGRIGRLVIKLLLENEDIELVAVNDLADPSTLAHLIQFDSVHGKYPEKVTLVNNDLVIKGKRIKIFAEKNPAQLPWRELDVDIVLESTGRFTDHEGASLHLKAGAKKVIITAPSKSENVPTVVLGVNDHILNGGEDIISNASCTTNCLAPMVKILNDHFGIIKGYVSTVHSYTNDQNLHDAPHRDLRRARAAAYSIIPTTTHAALAMELVLPELKGKIEASAMRVPVPDGSLTDLIVLLNENVTTGQINSIFEQESKAAFKGILEYTNDPLVSIDIIGNPHSCIIDAGLTSAQGNLVKLVGWYDNESGYSNRLVDLVLRLS